MSFSLSLSLSLPLSLYFWLIPWSVEAGCVTQGILASFFFHFLIVNSRPPDSGPLKDSQQGAPRTGAWYTRHFRWSDSGPIEAGKYKDMGQMAGKPPHFSTLLHHLFKVQGLLVSGQWVEACLQTIVEHNPWFSDEGSFDLEIWHRVKEKVEWTIRQGKNIPIDF